LETEGDDFGGSLAAEQLQDAPPPPPRIFPDISRFPVSGVDYALP